MHLNEPPSKLWTKSFITLTLCMLLLILNLHMLLSSFPLFLKNIFFANDFTVSIVTGSFALSAIASRLIVVPLMKVVNYKVILIVGLGFAAVNTLLNVFVESIAFLIVIRIGFGIGFGIASTIIPTLLSRTLPSRRMGEGIGYFGLAGSLAMSIGPILGLNIMGSYGFSTLSWIGSLVIVLIFPLLYLLGPAQTTSMKPKHKAHSNKQVKANDEATGESTKPEAKIKMNFSLLLPAILNFLLSIIYSGLLSFIALYGEILELDQIGLFFMFNAFAIIIIRPISGKLFDRKGHAIVLIPATLCVIASLIVLSFATTIAMVIVSALLYGLGSGAIQPTLQAWMLGKVTKADHGLVNGVFFNSTDLGIALGALILGVISSVTGYATMFLYASSFMVLFLVLYCISHVLAKRQTS